MLLLFFSASDEPEVDIGTGPTYFHIDATPLSDDAGTPHTFTITAEPI